ncbi:cytosine-specific methyltransferase [Paramecium bursaria Chlorella virus CVM-1]|uniref:Uncharacterized protein N748L n=2 Tax=Paramecium bursaria Chlorella virus A1 TaxID=381899 RepID=A7J8A2_PBCVF|nr:DNA methyltransferase [Paramecium bursaria Chlorella virus FR483]YP_009701995.1 DNA methyltransferase [Paramecium bursaria Chlorella virus CVA-1]AGE48974.1 cytosine-specific methyltransferase [Paramecium bursaria Chlorella virus AP110A]AGE51998.1 cytosine-specific methyltransferase [Paramecium bursaria Chlorella virus CVM-1]AGE52337.1 cytosine-specific methyltransferase [Paramecium bursaria Chlorella virus CVR-1]ABT16033.1 hypothetical protein FR483_N748L [Paramecium bursaria Chlorella viru
MNALELFAGVGGITHGLRGYVTPHAFVEYETEASEFLKHKNKPVHGDITKFDASEYKGIVDIVTAGWPCTGFSTAGKGTGFEHAASGLFTEVVRVVRECDPTYIFLENSHVLAQLKNLKVVISELSHIGYDCRWFTCRSNDSLIGAHHQRYRWFCLAYKKGTTVDIPKIHADKFDWTSQPPSKQEKTDTRENRRLIKFMGNSVVPTQVRHSFESMLDMTLEGEPVTDRDVIVKCGYATDGVMFKKAVAQQTIPKLNIVLTPGVIPEVHSVPNDDNILREAYNLPFWNTPAFCYHKSSKGSRVLTKRQKNNLHTQVKFCEGGEMNAYLSGKFCAWLMGYEPEYLEHLMKY